MTFDATAVPTRQGPSRLSRRLLVPILLSVGLGCASAQAQEYRIVHCLHGCPLGADEQNHLILRPIYALSYNVDRKSADWVAFQVNAATVGIASSLSREAVADETVPETLQAEDFKAAADQRLIMGQYVPLVNFAATPYWSDVNYLSNTVARSSSLTQGAWNGLDWAIRNLVNRQEGLYVITGPVFDADAEPLLLNTDKEHRVPDGFYKIVASREGELAAFLFRQDTTVGTHHCDLQATVADIERLTGLQYFPRSNRSMSETLSSRLGCRY